MTNNLNLFISKSLLISIPIPYIFLLSIDYKLFPDLFLKMFMVGMAFEDLVAQFSPAALVILVTGRILGEPAAEHPHLLGDHLMDAPEA